MAFFTRINYIVNKRNKNFVNRAKIYVSNASGKSWSKAISFQYNSDDYSCAHPSISVDGNTLYFASDMPGGQGGQDIWMCKRNGDIWDKPVNLGIDVNTSGDELFPFIRKDGMLFFSSNGLPGFGDLDIFSAKNIEGRWLLNRNEGLFLNSTADDFGIVFSSDTTGYFSSNKEGGKGSDDIYSFKYTNKSIVVDGIVLLTENVNDPAKDVKVYLLNDKGAILDSTRTNDKGYFVFKNLDIEKVYMVEVDESNTTLKNKSRYYLADKNGSIARITHKEGANKKFVFKNLPVNTNGLPDLYNEDELSLAGNLLFGENPSKPVANKKVTIKNEFGDVVEETTTNEFGAFAFKNLPIDQNYTLSIDDSDIPADTKIILTNKSGKEVKIGKAGYKGKFQFAILNTDKTSIQDLLVDDKDLIMALNGYLLDQDKKPLTNAKVSILNNSALVEDINTDDKGKFTFKNLGTDKNYVFGIDDSDPRFSNVSKILVADSRGRIVREIKRDKNGKFVFELLDIDKVAFGDFTVDDPWLQVLEMKNKQKQEAITIVEKLYYAYGDFKIDIAGKNILDKVISILNTNKNLNIELSSHTDSRSTDSYNLTLSQKRAKAAVDYMIAKGIDKSRLKAIGYGETRLLNHCKSDVPCSEEEHAINRRTEFKIVEVGKI
jgi:outer membrane protein OmpA-like peptidoglycan-associated protein